jgi:hypothetical protein
MITKEHIQKLLAERVRDNGEVDPLIVTSWEPFALASGDGWTGIGVPAGMLLAQVVLKEALKNSKD